MSLLAVLGTATTLATTTTSVMAANNTNVNATQTQSPTNNTQRNGVLTINYRNDQAVTVWNQPGGKPTGKYLSNNTSWKFFATAQAYGETWYNLGGNQWVPAKYVVEGLHLNNNVASNANTNNYNNVATTYNNNTASSYSNNSYSGNSYSTPSTVSYAGNTGNSSYTSTVSGSEQAAKDWIAARESGGSYSAVNGSSGAYGKYQLLPAYLNGDYSAANQERVADNYVKSRYGSWTAAQSFWQMHGWY